MVQVFGIDTIKRKVFEWLGIVEQDLQSVLEAKAQEIESFMRANAPWNDETGEARRLLFCTVQAVGEGRFNVQSGGFAMPVSTGVSQGFNVVLHGDSDHNLFLEVSNGGKYAIITPTFYRAQVEIVEVAQRAVNR